MAHDHHQKLAPGQRPFPLAPLVGAALLIFVSLVTVAGYRLLVDTQASPDSNARVVASRQLRFEDTSDGRVIVRDASDGSIVQTMPVGEYGFVRATVRGLVRTRKALGENDKTLPFMIELRESGRLLLIDPLTDQEVDLWAFGASNAQQFAELLGNEETSNGQSRAISALGAPSNAETNTHSQTEISN